MELNAAQHEAVTTLSGPVLVLAGAGTGKTRVVTYRIAELIRNGVDPERILAVTFTNKAANEMQQRAAALIGKRVKRRPEISTFHSLCVRILRRNIRRLGYPASFAIYDRGEQESVARAALREIRVDRGVLRPADLVHYIGRWKTASLGPEQAAAAAQTDKEHLAASAYRRYQRALKAAGALDFDDLLRCTEELFRRHAQVRQSEAARFDHLLVDEYQDTNASQYRIVRALAAGHRNLCVVGDDDQSIYGWRGAEVTHILRFQHDWPGAKVVRLEVNYRSTRQILAWANTLIAQNKLRHPKVLRTTRRGEPPRILQLRDEQEEACTVVGEIAERIGQKKCRPRDVAILCRTNEQPRAFETELRQAKIPYVLLGGMSFYDRKEVRDMLAYLKLLVNPRDEVALLRVINTPVRGIGPTAVGRLMDAAVAEGCPLWEVLPKAEQLDGLAPKVLESLDSFRLLVAAYRKRLKEQEPVELLRRLVGEIGYRDELGRLYRDTEEQESRWAMVEELVNALAAYCGRGSQATLAGFLQEVALAGREEEKDKDSQLDRNAVALMTLHSAKGLEFQEVYVAGMEEGLLPHRRSLDGTPAAIEEERRLCYVGVTRARRRLTLSVALTRRRWGRARPMQPSRFLYELTGQADNPNYQAAVGKHRASAGPTKPGHAAASVCSGRSTWTNKTRTARSPRTGRRRPK